MAEKTPPATPAPATTAPDPLSTIADLGEAKAKWKAAAKRMSDELKALKVENDDLKKKVITPDEATKRITELEAKIRDRSHFDKFAELAKGAKAKDSALKALWKLADFKPETDEIDEKALGELVTRLKGEHDYAFDVETDPAIKAAADAAAKYKTPPPGGRGQRNAGGDGTIVTADMRADPKFMLDPRNREIITAAAKEGRFR